MLGPEGNPPQQRERPKLPPLRLFRVLKPNGATEEISCHIVATPDSGGLVFIEGVVDSDGDAVQRYRKGFSALGYVEWEEIPVPPTSILSIN